VHGDGGGSLDDEVEPDPAAVLLDHGLPYLELDVLARSQDVTEVTVAEPGEQRHDS
jgi:hypothetical protein